MFTTEEHWKFFAEFCEYELKAGGPDPHMKLAAKMAEGLPFEEQVWRAGCYIACYNAPFGEAIWREWSFDRIKSAPEDMEPWLEANWSKFITRRERRCVRRPEWMAEYLLGYAEFVDTVPGLLDQTDGMNALDRYDVFWEACLEVPRLGRYVALKLLEFYRRNSLADIELGDLRPEGAWSPREQLGVLFPEHKEVADEDDSPELLDLANKLSFATQARLTKQYGLKLDMFEIQVLLCDYKQSWKGKRQYPGRSIDSELQYLLKAEELWGYKSDMWAAREKLFPVEHLGEKQGWQGPRDEAATALAHHKYTWSDLKYDYSRTENFSKPAARRRKMVTAPPCDRIHVILEDKLFQSASWNSLSEKMKKDLVEYYGLTGIVSLWVGEKDLSPYVQFYKHHPLPDGKSAPDVTQVVSEVSSKIRNGGRVLVMCHAGRNRSGFVTAQVVMSLLKCTGEEAVKAVRAGRPRSLANEAFETHITGLPRAPKKGLLF